MQYLLSIIQQNNQQRTYHNAKHSDHNFNEPNKNNV